MVYANSYIISRCQAVRWKFLMGENIQTLFQFTIFLFCSLYIFYFTFFYLKAPGRWSTKGTAGTKPVSPARDASSPLAPRASSLRTTTTTACRATRSSSPCSVCTARRYDAQLWMSSSQMCQIQVSFCLQSKSHSYYMYNKKVWQRDTCSLLLAHHHWRGDLPWPALA